MIRILVVEDDEKLNKIVCTYLNDSGFQAKGCLSANTAYEEMYNNRYELIISDIMMPKIDGFEFARTVRQVNKNIPILFMSAKDDLPSKQKGFQLGIDDYMVKPVELEELILRVRALLRRASIETERKIIVGNLVLDANGMSAEVDGEEISLTTREFNIVFKLLSYPKKTFSRVQLMDEFWGVESSTSLWAVDVYVTKLRDKLSACDGFKIDVADGQRKEYAAAVESAAVRLADLITNILKLNKLDNQRINPEVKVYDVSRQLCECILQYEEAWEEKQIELETELEDEVYVRADEHLMELVWNNLLSNAVKFTEPRGMITIRQKSDEQYVTVSVTDTGCGMNENIMKHMFDKFYQGDTSHSKEGNGLGLALVKRVVELMDGEILVRSGVGKGSTFTVTLPAVKIDRERGKIE